LSHTLRRLSYVVPFANFQFISLAPASCSAAALRRFENLPLAIRSFHFWSKVPLRRKATLDKAAIHLTGHSVKKLTVQKFNLQNPGLGPTSSSIPSQTNFYEYN
jgi:hypothetical protein